MRQVMFHAEAGSQDPRNKKKFTALAKEFILARGRMGASTYEIANYLSRGGIHLVTLDRAEQTMRVVEDSLGMTVRNLAPGRRHYTAMVI